MTGFDLLLIAVFAVSIGFAALRGAIRELGTLIALLFGVLMAWIFTGVLVSAMGKDDFIATVAAAGALIAIGFIAAHIVITIFSGRIELTLQHARIDRIAGGVYGFVRAFALIGLAFIGYSYYLEPDSRPDSVKNAALLPLVNGAAGFMRTFAPNDPIGGDPLSGDRRSGDGAPEAEQASPRQRDADARATQTTDIPPADRRALNEIVTTVTTTQPFDDQAGDGARADTQNSSQSGPRDEIAAILAERDPSGLSAAGQSAAGRSTPRQSD